MSKVFPPTEREKALLDFIRTYFATKGIMPSYDEMRDWAGLNSKSGIARMIDSLIDKGHLDRMPAKARALSLTAANISTADALAAVLVRCRLSPVSSAELRTLLVKEARA